MSGAFLSLELCATCRAGHANFLAAIAPHLRVTVELLSLPAVLSAAATTDEAIVAPSFVLHGFSRSTIVGFVMDFSRNASLESTDSLTAVHTTPIAHLLCTVVLHPVTVA